MSAWQLNRGRVLCGEKNVCRIHSLIPAKAVLLDRLTYRLSRVVDTFEKRELDLCLSFVVFEDTLYHADDVGGLIGPRLPCNDFIVCVQDYRLQPKVQLLLPHKLGRNQSGPVHFVPPLVPFEVTGVVSWSRLSDRRRALGTWTSDECCEYLLSLRAEWAIRPAKCELLDSTVNLLTVRIVELGDPFVMPRTARPTRTQFSKVAEDIMNLPDPLARSSGHGTDTDGVPAHGGRGQGDVVTDGVDNDAVFSDSDLEYGAHVGDDELVEGLPPDLVDDFHVEVECDETTPPHDTANGEEPDDNDDEGDPSDGAWTPERYADIATIDDDGYVLCPAPPFHEMTKRQIGRITDWPAHKPPENRSVSCSCFLHGACKSPARLRRYVTNRQLLVWLFTARLEDRPSRDRKAELRIEHKGAFVYPGAARP